MKNKPVKVTAFVGSYRKGGIIDTTVDEILASARKEGAETTKIYLIDKPIEFCTNCRACTQEAGDKPGECPLGDDMKKLLDEIESSDSLVFASPLNFWSVTAVTKRFIERLVCYGYWPWGAAAPKVRKTEKRKRAVIVTSSAAPAIIARIFTPLVSNLKKVSALLGARVIGVVSIGLACRESRQQISERAKSRARALGQKLAVRRQ